MSKKLSKPVYFDLDGICQMKIYGEPALVDAVSRELGFYRINPQEAPLTLDMEIELRNFSDFQKSGNPREMPPYDFFGSHKLAKWAIRFERLGQSPRRIKFYGNIFSRMIVAKQIVEPALRWLAQDLGFIFVHSTALVKDGKGVLIAGRGGSGKTRILLHWLKQGNAFVSDDFTILSYGRARRYVTPLRLGARLLRESGEGKNLTFASRASIYARTMLRRLVLNYARLQAKVDIKQIFPAIKMLEQVELSAVVALADKGQGMETISVEEMVEELVRINQDEMYGFSGYLSGLAERTGDRVYADFFSVQQARLLAFLQDIPCYRLYGVRKLDASGLESLIKKVIF